MKVLKDLERLIESELKEITKKGDITPTELENAYKAVDILKDIETIEAMQNAYDDDEYSERRGMSYAGAPYYYNEPGFYPRGYSNKTYRGNGHYMGGSYRNDGYSMHYQEKDETMEKLEQMLHSAANDQEKAVIKKMMDRLYD